MSVINRARVGAGCSALMLLSSLAGQDESVLPTTVSEAIDEMVLKAELVVYARPVTVQRIQSSPRRGFRRPWYPKHIDVVTLHIEEVLVGRPGLDQVVVILPGIGDAPSAKPGVYFLQDTKSLLIWGSKRTLKGITKAAGTATIFERHSDDEGLWPESETGLQLTLPPGTSIASRSIAKDRAIELVGHSAKRVFPHVRAFLATTGPAPWGVEIDSQRFMNNYPGTVPLRLPEDEWAALLAALDSPRFMELDRHLGSAIAPCEPYVGIEYRTVQGLHRTDCYSYDSVPDAQRSQFTAFLKLWSMMPGEDRPHWGK